jgi:biotin carboxyl carrier protein
LAETDDARTIERLAEETLPALIGRLDASSLGELEVRKGTWRVRLRRTAAPAPVPRTARWGRRSTDVHPPARRDAPTTPSPAPEPAPKQAGAVARAASGNGTGPVPLTPVGPGRERAAPRELGRRTATSPAVGYYLPLDDVTPGRRVRSGDVIGHVDVLGVRVEVPSPADGVVGRVLAQSGEAVEYGQELLRIDLASAVDGIHDEADALPPSEA